MARSKTNGTPPRRGAGVPNAALRAADPRVRARAERRPGVRDAPITAAVFPAEVPLFTKACKLAGVSRSDVMRQALIAVAEAQGVVDRRESDAEA